MKLIIGNAMNTLALQGLSPKEDIGYLLTEIIPTWTSWAYDEEIDILTVDFYIVLSPRVSELGKVIDNGYTLG